MNMPMLKAERSAAVRIVAPGADLTRYRPGDRGAARAAFGIDPHAHLLAAWGLPRPEKAGWKALYGSGSLVPTAAEERARPVASSS